ncbi:membrane-associated protein, putative, partial [Bodo saltans]
MVLVVAIVAAAVSFGPLYTASLNAAVDTGMAFSATISREITASVTRELDAMQNITSVLVNAAKFGGYSEDNVRGVTQWLTYATSFGADSANLIFDSGITWTATREMQNGSDVQHGSCALIKYNMTTAELYMINTSDFSTISGPIFYADALDYRTHAYYPTLRSRQAWGHVTIEEFDGFYEAVLPCGAPLVLPNKTSVGAIYLHTRANVIVEYVRELEVAKTGRVMLFDPSSGSLVATNNPADPLTKSVNGTVVDAKFTDATDPLIRRVALSDGQEIFACSPLPCAFELGHGNDLVYVTVSNVNDSFGLGLRLVVMIPSDDFLGEIRSSATSSLGAAAGAVVGLLLLSIVAVVMIVRPLQRLELKIYASVTLEEDDEDDDGAGKSIFTEVLRIEEAYDKL